MSLLYFAKVPFTESFSCGFQKRIRRNLRRPVKKPYEVNGVFIRELVVQPRRRVVLRILLHGRRDEQSCIAVHGIGHIGQRKERKIRQDRSIYMGRGGRVRRGVRTVCRERGSVHNGERWVPVWPEPPGLRRWEHQL